jgi:hypothetical protein
MPSHLYYQHTFSAAAAMNTDITLLGEDNDAKTPDQLIMVNVSPAQLNSILSYSSQWTAGAGPTGAAGDQPTPDPKVNFNDVATSTRAVALQNLFKAAGSAGDANPTMTDDSGDSSLETLQNYFVNLSFSWNLKDDAGVVDATDLNAIPAENVTKVEIGAITSDTLAQVLPGAKDGDTYVADHPAGEEDYARDLFEQAVAAGKAPAGGVTNFEVNDSVTVYVTYNLAKTKTFLLDTVQDSGTAKFRIAGTDIEVGNSTVLSGTASVTIAWQFKAVA